ncbi:helix-turn-helix transcriptional regulator [Actinospica robiniae]|uniref:helix-turn-helix transcriptional regulator n=1 Tax=Actinospica robiniae TaxID=304901 RepID=UPI000408CFA9|nr:helix-turn-helix transcriptional regulator [Actinospica robiniae]
MTGAHADPAAQARAARWMAELREARIEADLTQQAVAEALGVRASSVTEWEGGRLASWENFCAFGREIGVRLVVLDRDGRRRDGAANVVAGEPWERTELRRLAVALRAERAAIGLSRAAVAAEIGISPWSFAHLERAQLSPRLIVLASWVGSLKSDIQWQPIV